MSRRSTILPVLYGICSGLDIFFSGTDTHGLRFFTKPLLMPLLMLLLALENGLQSRFSNRIILALAASWLGDLFLLFRGFFLPGLLSFLVAHICYIIALANLPGKGLVQHRPLLAVPVLLYLAIVYGSLVTELGTLKIPVLLYSCFIGGFLVSAINVSGKLPKHPAQLFCWGALLFVLSDTLLAFARFKYDFPFGSPLIMLTYCAAQWLIVKATRITRERNDI